MAEITTLEAAASAAGARLREARGLKDDLDLAQERVRQLEAELATAQSADSGANKEMLAMKEELKSVVEENAALRASAGDGAKVKKEMTAIKSENVRLKVELEQLENALAMKKEEAEKHREAYVTANGQIGALTQQLENANQQLDVLKHNSEPIGRKSERLPSLMDEMGSEEVDAVKKALHEKEEELKALQESIDEEREQFKQILKEKNNDKQLEQCKKEMENLRKELEESRSKKSEEDNEGSKKKDQDNERFAKLQKESEHWKQEASKQASTVKGLQQQLMEVKSAKERVEKSDDDNNDELIRSLEEERDQLKHYLKMAKEKLLDLQKNSGSNAAELEAKALSTHVHLQGLHILRLKHELESLKQKQSESYSSKQNGLLNHLRAEIDPFP